MRVEAAVEFLGTQEIYADGLLAVLHVRVMSRILAQLNPRLPSTKKIIPVAGSVINKMVITAPKRN